MCKVIAHVRHVNPDVDDVGHRPAGLLDERPDVLEAAAPLRRGVASPDDVAVSVHRRLAGDDEPFAHTERRALGPTAGRLRSRRLYDLEPHSVLLLLAPTERLDQRP